MKTKLIMFVAMCMIAAATSFAQTNEKVHKIENGETIESIAEKYGVTPDDIRNANPNAGGYFFAGMSIKIPEKSEAIIESETAAKEDAVNAFFNNNSTDIQTYQTENKSTVTPYDFGYWGFSYTSSFEEADKGAYYFDWQIFHDSGWGIEFGLGANYGIIDSDYASVLFKIGAAYGYVISDNMLLATSFCFDGNSHGTGEYTERVYVDTDASWGGRYANVKRKGEQKFDWGLSLKPQLVFKTGKIRPHLGFSFNWSEATKDISVGFIVGIGF